VNGQQACWRPANIPKINPTFGRRAIIAWRCPVSSGAPYETSTPPAVLRIAAAQKTYLRRPVRIVVGFPPSGETNLYAV
jgi:hypothetical protein